MLEFTLNIDWLVVLVWTIAFMFFGYWIGWRSRERTALNLLAQMEQHFMEQQQTELENSIARVEKHEDSFILYDEKTDEFLAQGKDWKELKDVLASRFKNRTISVRRDDAYDVGLDLDESL